MKHSITGKFKEKEQNKIIIVISDNEYGINMNPNLETVFKGINMNSFLNKNKVILPKSVDSIEVFNKYLNIVCAIRKINNDFFYNDLLDVIEIVKMIDISIDLKDNEITDKLIEDKLKVMITKENCLLILSKYSKCQQERSQKAIESLINLSIAVAAKKLNELIVLSNRNNIRDDHINDDLLSLPEDIFSRIISKNLKDHSHSGYDHSNIMQLLMKKRKIENNDIFALIEDEKNISINSFEKEIENNNVISFTNFEWTLNNCSFKSDFYKESDIYYYDTRMIKLYCYYDYQKDEYSAAFQLIPNQNKSIKEENICILTDCSINNINDNSINNTYLNYIDSSSNIKILILRLNSFSFLLRSNNEIYSKITLNVNFSVNYVLPAIIQHISQKFYMYYMLPSITKLSRKTLWIILKNKYLYLRVEDEVLTAILAWMKNKTNPKEESLLSLFTIINWKELSLDSLMEIITSYSKLLIALPQLETLVKEEFDRRLKAEYSKQESTYSFTNELIDKLMNKSLKNQQCYQQINPIRKKNINNNTSIFHTTDYTTLISRNNFSTNNDYLNSCSHMEDLHSNSLIMKTNSSFIRQTQNNEFVNQSLKHFRPRTFVKSDISLMNTKTESNESKKVYHAKNKSLSLELNLLTNSSCWVNTSISKRNETTQLKSQLEIIEKKINKTKHNKHIRYNTATKFSNMTFKSPKSKQSTKKQFAPSNLTFINK